MIELYVSSNVLSIYMLGLHLPSLLSYTSYLQVNLPLAIKEVISQFQSCGPISYCSVVGDIRISASRLEFGQVFKIRLICHKQKIELLRLVAR